ncbi:hypothetical protein [Nonomuraea sp. NPDC048916]|uniref:hypothetical protein n=1 Tax=Nonomuraea sp. NPDC048916 TaxID=3154232 RepID=UPI0033D03882
MTIEFASGLTAGMIADLAFGMTADLTFAKPFAKPFAKRFALVRRKNVGLIPGDLDGRLLVGVVGAPARGQHIAGHIGVQRPALSILIRPVVLVASHGVPL